MKLPRRRFLHLAAASSAVSATSRIALALDYPTRPVHIIVGYRPGGPADIVSRMIGQWLLERLGQPVIIENRPGAATNIATEAVAHAPPDGYTLLTAFSTNTVNPALYPDLNFNFIRDITMVAGLTSFPLVLVVNPAVPVSSVPELIAYAKAHPGKISLASFGTGTISHVAGVLFKMKAGIEMVHVPYRGSAPLVIDLLAGQVQAAVDNLQSSVEYIRGGANYAPSRSRLQRVRRGCRTSRRLANFCRVMRSTRGSGLEPLRIRLSRSLISSTRRSMRGSPIPRSVGASLTWPARHSLPRLPRSTSSSLSKPRNGAR
jgi:tripartite-type tricarboxylate transporter receptor subunit TctC